MIHLYVFGLFSCFLCLFFKCPHAISGIVDGDRNLWKGRGFVHNVTLSPVNAGRISSKSGHPCPCQYCSQGPPAERTGRGSLLNLLLMCLQCSNLSWRWTELNWTLKQSVVPGMIWYYVYTCQRLLTPYCAHVKNNLSLEQNIFKV